MNTPITDEASFSTVYQGEIVEASFARRLELDRAALIEALEDMTKVLSLVAGETAPVPRIALSYARTTLSAARANFPES